MSLGCVLRRRPRQRSKMAPVSTLATTARRMRCSSRPPLRRGPTQRRSRTNARPQYRPAYGMTARPPFPKHSPGPRWRQPRPSRTNVLPRYHPAYGMTARPRPLRATTGPRTLLPRPGRPRPGETKRNRKETSATSTKRIDNERSPTPGSRPRAVSRPNPPKRLIAPQITVGPGSSPYLLHREGNAALCAVPADHDIDRDVS